MTLYQVWTGSRGDRGEQREQSGPEGRPGGRPHPDGRGPEPGPSGFRRPLLQVARGQVLPRRGLRYYGGGELRLGERGERVDRIAGGKRCPPRKVTARK